MGCRGFPASSRPSREAYRERPDDVAALRRRRSLERLRAARGVPRPTPATSTRRCRTGPPRRCSAHVDRGRGRARRRAEVPPPAASSSSSSASTGPPATRRCSTPSRSPAIAWRAGGIYDQVGGGFHRYSVDAPLARPALREDALRQRAATPAVPGGLPGHGRSRCIGVSRRRRLDYVLATCATRTAASTRPPTPTARARRGSTSSGAATRSPRLVDPGDLDLVCRYWDITEEGNFEGHNILHADAHGRAGGAALRAEPRRTRAARSSGRARGSSRHAAGRVPPLRDEKILTSWNAPHDRHARRGGPGARRAPLRRSGGTGAADFIWDAACATAAGCCTAGRQAARSSGAFLDDHAYLAAALIDLYEATRRPRATSSGRASWSRRSIARFRDDGGRRLLLHRARRGASHRAEQVAAPTARSPSGNAVAAHALLRLHHLTRRGRAYRERGPRRSCGSTTTRRPQPVRLRDVSPGARALRARARPRWSWSRDDPARARAAVGRRWRGATCRTAPWSRPTPGDPTPLAPARDRPAVGGRATAYVCRHFTCSAPVTTPEELGRLLQES